MEEGLAEEVTPIDVADGQLQQGKENEYSLKPESGNMLESQEIIIPGETNSPEGSFHMLADMLEGKNVNRSLNSVDASNHSCASPRSMDDGGVMVEELTVRNYNSANLAVVGPSSNRERMQTRQNRWQHLYQLAGGSGSGSLHVHGDNNNPGFAIRDDAWHMPFPEFLAQKPRGNDSKRAVEELTNSENNRVSGIQSSHPGIRTKILSSSGFSEFFVKTTLKGKGIVYRGPRHDGFRVENRDQSYTNGAGGIVEASGASLKIDNGPLMASSASMKAIGGSLLVSNASLSLDAKSMQYDIAGCGLRVSDQDGVTLREWLKAKCHKVGKVVCLSIFRQIVDLVENYHAQGVALRDLQPSCFKLLQPNCVKYLGSTVQCGIDNFTNKDSPHPDNWLSRRRPPDHGMIPYSGLCTKKQKCIENLNVIRQWPQFTSNYGLKHEDASASNMKISGTQSYSHQLNDRNPSKEYGVQKMRNSPLFSNTVQPHPSSVFDELEGKWYASLEELNEGICTTSSNIYNLGVLLFELLGRFESERAHVAAMTDLRHRILPPNFLSENPKEAGFCLWLLHPEPSSRPTTREILQSDVINGLSEMCAEELSASIGQDEAETELLLHFLTLVEEHKRKQASKLDEDIRCLEADIREVESRHRLKKPLVCSSLHNKFVNKDPSGSEELSRLSPSSMTNEMRLLKNIVQLENAYFSTRSKIQLPETDSTTCLDKDLLRNRENWCSVPKDEEEQNSADPLGAFFEGLCKYARYNKFEVRGLLRTGDFNNSANVICSLSFDRDEDFFATAGVSKKIKIFEFNALFNNSVDIHYPVIEMSNKSKLSCVCWNNYIKNYLASTDYDGVVKLWDATTGQGVFHYMEHEKRAWSVDFSQICPTKLASGSDDCSVKLWNINENKCLGTIRNIANVCCVQFSSHSTHLLAFGSADYRTYCYDLRNMRTPWCVLTGHAKAVSYVKFLDSETIVTASTDNSLKLWDLNRTNPSGLSTNACSLTLGGHTNEKNFVGLSTADGYIACGSETNEVYAYHRSLPMPITSHKFGSIDPISGQETDDDNGLFVSSVCWRGKSDMVVAANSSGCIKVLQMV